MLLKSWCVALAVEMVVRRENYYWLEYMWEGGTAGGFESTCDEGTRAMKGSRSLTTPAKRKSKETEKQKEKKEKDR